MSDLTDLFSWTLPRFDGKTKGFEVIKLIVDLQHCLQAYIGVAKDLNAMVIAFRGSQEHRFLDAIMRAKDLYGAINIMVTGHSIGGAMASFWGLNLVFLED